MKKTVAILAAAAFVAGCDTMGDQTKGTLIGAGVGAAAGAAISAGTGGKAGTGAAIGAVAGAIGGNLWSKRMEDKKKAMEQATAGTGIDVTRTADNQLKLNVPSDAGFATGSADLQPNLLPILDQLSAGLDAGTLLKVVGHTDSTGSDAINNPLSVNRARAVQNYLVGKGVSSSRIEVLGEGSHQPIADNGTIDGRAANRRVEIFLREPEKQG